MGRMVSIGQEEQGVVNPDDPVFGVTVTAPMPIEIPAWILIFLAAVVLVAILKR